MVTSREQLRKEAKERLLISDYLRASLKKKGSKWYTVCPVHKGRSANACIMPDIGRGELLRCWSCGVELDIIGVVRADRNCSENEALEVILGETPSSVASCAATLAPKVKPQPLLQSFKPFQELNQQEQRKILAYFHSRSIAPALAIEALEKNNIKVGLVFKGKYHQIAFVTTGMSIVLRWDKVERKNTKMNYGGNRPLPLIINNSKEIYITEGLEDALSLSMLGLNSMSINGVGNIENALECIVERFQPTNEYKIIIALDNDKAGIEGAKELKQLLLSLGYKVGAITNHFRAKKKDINDLLQAGLLNKSNVNIKYFN